MRELPSSLEAERAVLSAILIQGRSIQNLLDLISHEDFYFPNNRAIFEAMEELNRENLPIDSTTLIDKLTKNQTLEKIGGREFIEILADVVPTAANVNYHAQIVHEKSILRQLINTSEVIIQSVYESSETTSELLDFAEKKILSIAGGKSTGNLESLRSILPRVFAYLDENIKNGGGITGVPSTFVDLDTMTAGFQKSDLILVAARPSMGKTAFALNIATEVALRDLPVAFFSLEMSKEQLSERMLSTSSGVQSQKLRSGSLDEDDWDRLLEESDRLSRAKLFIDDSSAMNVMEIRSRARRLKSEQGLALIIIDYIQLMQGSKATRGELNRNQEISEISRGLKSLARELEVPLIALSQLSRAVELRSNKRPQLSDLRESGALEQDADIVMFLYRDDYYDPETEKKNTTEVIIAKHRNGPVGTVELSFQKDITKFGNILYQDPPPE
ncbi:MAG: replicative DNA helicase [Selenomonadaceae bacterium]|nr:replicative DNA helicase [Selenomonadaceae bacterium]